MKKTLTALLIVILIFACVFVLLACGEETPVDPPSSGNEASSNPDEDNKPENPDDVKPTEHAHSPNHFKANEATCIAAGNIEYWYCSDCDKYFKDKECSKEIEADDESIMTELAIPAKGHSYKDNVCTVCGKKEKYTVSFDSNGGTDVLSVQVAENSKLTAPNNPTKNGYMFAGWFIDSECKEAWDFSEETVISDMTLYAGWSVEAGKIIAVENASIDEMNILMVVSEDTEYVSLSGAVVIGGSATWKLYYDRLGQMEIPTKIAASKSGELLAGDNVFYVVTTTTDNTQVRTYTLTVHRIHDVAVTFKDEETVIAVVPLKSYGTVGALAEDIIAGYKITGYTDIANNPFYPDSEGAIITANAIVFVNKIANNYKVSIDANGGEILCTEKEVTYDDSYFMPVPSRIGYTFLGYTYDDDFLTDNEGICIENYNIADDITLKAEWRVNSYSVFAEKNNDLAGNIIGAGYHDYDSEVTITATTNPGYTWLGWYEGDTKVSEETSLSYTFTMPAENKTYTAKWTYYTVMTTTNDSEAGAFTQYNEEKVTVGEESTIIATTNAGYTWLGWYEGETKVSEDTSLSYTFTMPAENKTYTAKWIVCPITLEKNISEAGTVGGVEGATAVGESITITATANRGYTWLGWYDGDTKVSTGTSLSYTFTMPAENKTYTAKWTYYTITTETNNSEAGAFTQYSEEKITVGEEVTITATTNVGYTWLGWYEGDTKVSEGTSLNYTFTMSAENKTYTAKWTYYTVTTTANDIEAGTYTQYGEEKVTVGEETTITATTNPGYTWLGWYEGENKVSEGSSLSYTFEMPAENKTYTAKWEVAEEMRNFVFNSTPNTCSITGVVDKSVNEINVPDYVSDIAKGAFRGCSGLISITLPFVGASPTATGYEGVFGYIFGYERTSSSSSAISGATYQYCDSYYYHYYIPSSIRSVTVTGGAINARAFNNCLMLTSIVIPDSVTSIGDYAFYNCSGLTGELVIPDSVTSIWEYAFYNCSGLTSVTIGNSVTSIGERAFYNCNGLTSIVIPESVTYIDRCAFIDCERLTGVYITDILKWCDILFVDNYANPLYYAHSLYLNGELVTDLVIPDGVTKIGTWTFYNCIGLTSIVIPNSVRSIGIFAFVRCYRLVEVYNKSSLNISKGSDSNGSVGYYALNVYTPDSGESKLSTDSDGYIICIDGNHIVLVGYVGTETDLILPSNVTKIYKYAFYNCTELTSVTIGNSVTSIGEYAFYNCSGLKSVTIGNSVTSIGYDAFYKCSGLISITLPFVGASPTATGYESVFGYIFGYALSNSSLATSGETYQNQHYYESSNKYYCHYYIPLSLRSVTITGETIKRTSHRELKN